MSEPSKEAVEAALDKFMGAVPWRESRHNAEFRKNMDRALIAALPHLLAGKGAEIAALKEALKLAREDIIQTMETFGDDEPETDKTIIAIDAALEMSGGMR